MALQASGQICLNDIHVEAGGTTGTPVCINDSDIRGLISKASGAQMCFSEWYGASATQSYTITEGSECSGYICRYGYYDGSFLGYTSIGSINSTSFTDKSGNSRTIWQLNRVGSTLYFGLRGRDPQDAFDTLTITLNGTVYNFARTSAATSTSPPTSQNFIEYRWTVSGTTSTNLNAQLNGSGTTSFSLS